MNAYMNHGHWVADCPRCSSAEELQPGQKFRCRNEGGLGGCGHTEEVIWPNEIVEIGQILSHRPMPNRNWYPSEDLADLRQENIDHGIGV